MFENQSNYNCCITIDNGEQYLVYANWIHNNGLAQWQGWHCNAGNTRFYIDQNFDIWSGECQNDYLGSLAGKWEIKTDTICKKLTCSGLTGGGVADDLITIKHE